MTVIHLINATLDGRCDHRSVVADDDLHAHALETITNADAILFGSAHIGFSPPTGHRLPRKVPAPLPSTSSPRFLR